MRAFFSKFEQLKSNDQTNNPIDVFSIIKTTERYLVGFEIRILQSIKSVNRFQASERALKLIFWINCIQLFIVYDK